MDHETLETQLEFPFLMEVRNQCYMASQYEHMLTCYQLYRALNEDSPTFSEYIPYYAKSGLAEDFFKREHVKYFYDVPEPLYK